MKYRTLSVSLAAAALAAVGLSAIHAQKVTSSAPSPLSAQASLPWKNSLGMRFVPVPETRLLCSVWEVRVQDFGAFVTAKNIEWYLPEFDQNTIHPAVNLSWAQAKAFCEWLTQKELASGAIKAGQRYRLPTDAEWSSACGIRSEDGSTPEKKYQQFLYLFPWGKGWPPPQGKAWGNYCDASALRVHPGWTVVEGGYDDGFIYTAPVGSYEANPYGIYDLSGNVWEWVEDLISPRSDLRVARGGCWLNSDQGMICLTARRGYKPETQEHQIGFRPVLDLGVAPR